MSGGISTVKANFTIRVVHCIMKVDSIMDNGMEKGNNMMKMVC